MTSARRPLDLVTTETQWQGLSPPYATIVADPPWPYDEGWPEWADRAGKNHRRRSLPYSPMPVDDIAALSVEDLAEPGSHLYLWTTNRYLWVAKDIALAWGFTPTQVLTWCKEPNGIGPGGLFATATEFIVFAQAPREKRDVPRAGHLIRQAREQAGVTRARLHALVRGGKPTGIVFRWEDDDSLPNQRDWQRLQEVLPALRGAERPDVEPPPPRVQNRIDRNWWTWQRGEHSEKPPAFLDVVERVSPSPYVELFARQPRLGWDSWGWGYEGAVS